MGIIGLMKTAGAPACTGHLVQVAASLLFLAVILLPSCVVGFQLWGLEELQSPVPRRALLQHHNQVQVIRTEMIHRDHPASPLRSTSSEKTLKERFVDALKRGNNRIQSITHHIAVGGAKSFQSQVSSGDGEYLMPISLGTPAQKSTVIVDTGSDLMWTQCLPCDSCYPQNDPLFNPAASSTYKLATCASALCQALPSTACTNAGDCEYGYGYGDGSVTEGLFASDTLSFAGSAGNVPNFAFGCGLANEGNFGAADGIVGLGQGPVSLVSQMRNSNLDAIFSYCLVGIDSTRTSPLLLGNANAAGVAYTPIVSNPVNPTFYYAGVTGVSVNGVPVNYPANSFNILANGNGGLIIDSGTTITYLVQAAYTPILQAIQNTVNYPKVDGSAIGLDMCFSTKGVANPVYPTVTFHFAGGANFILAPENNFLLLDPTADTTCLAMAGIDGFSILGNVQQQDHMMVFDVAAKRIGFKSVACDTV
jgi:hypothetical protein